jgi:BRCA1-associated protein
MRLVIDIFDHRAASAARRASGAFISQSAVAGHDLTSLDTFTGLPFELEQQVLSRCYPEHQNRGLRLPKSIWDDLKKPETFAVVADPISKSDKARQLNAHAAPFTPGQHSLGRPQPAGGGRSVSETIQPVFAPLRTLDWRFGPIHIDYLEAPIEHTPTSSLLSPKAQKAAMLELPAIFESRERAKTLESAGEDRKGRPVPGNAGTLDLGYGIVHLYKEDVDRPSDKAEEKAVPAGNRTAVDKEHDGTMVAVLAVPANWPTADFLEFVSEVVPDIEQMRIMR